MKQLFLTTIALVFTAISFSQTNTLPKSVIKSQTTTQPILIGMNKTPVRFASLRKTTLPLMNVNSPSTQRIKPISGSSTSTANSISRTPLRDKKTPGAPTTQKEGAVYCTETEVSEQNGEYEKIVLGNQSDKIYPGAIYYDNSVMNGAYNAPALTLRNYRINTSLFAASSSGSSSIEVQPSAGQVKDGVAELMRRTTRVLSPAIIDVQANNIYSAEQLSFFLQADYQGYGVDLTAEFNYERRQKKNLIFVKLKQIYFSVTVDNSTAGPALITGTPASNLVFVNKVNYGRIGILKIESDSSVEVIRAALNFAYNGNSSQVGLNTGIDYSKVLASSKVEGFFFGGDAANAFPVSSAADLPLFNEYVRNGLRLDPNVAPVPISYELKYLSDNATASVNSVTTYTERNCQTARSIKLILNGISIEDIHGGDCSYAWGSVKVEVYALNDRGTAVAQIWPVTENLREEPTNLIWNMPDSRNPQRNMINYASIRGGQNVDMTSINKTWNFYVDPTIPQDQIAIKVTCNINTNHKDNDIASLGFHGMQREETRTYRLSDVFVTSQQVSTRAKYGSMIVGPYASYAGSDRVHQFRAHFTVTAGR